MPRICTPLFIGASSFASYSRMKSPNSSFVPRKLFGDATTVVPTMAPSATVKGAVPFNCAQPSRVLPLNSGRQPSWAEAEPAAAARMATATR